MDLREAVTVRNSSKAKPRTTANIKQSKVLRPCVGTAVKHADNFVVTVLVNQLTLSALVLSSHDDAADTVKLKGASDLSASLAGSASKHTRVPNAWYSF